eukprot:TRINITY_DN7552_c0_g1_i1.p1 TRINITY_DN7552_c0_g1~~TRINITY_DN7552_c0_g1_i1.p1  ORF type:complete len:307 (+),score=51.82 TRINITY_DN7552_c0_g1_i1:191-1111(+)
MILVISLMGVLLSRILRICVGQPLKKNLSQVEKGSSMGVTLRSGGEGLLFEGKTGSLVKGYHPLKVGQVLQSIGVLEEEGQVVGEHEGRLYVITERSVICGIPCRTVKEITENYRIAAPPTDANWLKNIEKQQQPEPSSPIVEWHLTTSTTPSMLLDTNRATSSFWASVLPNERLLVTEGDYKSLVLLYGGLLDGSGVFDVVGWSVSDFPLQIPSVCSKSDHPASDHNPIKLFVPIGPLSQEVGVGANLASFISKYKIIKLNESQANDIQNCIWTSVAFRNDLQQPETATEAATRYWIETAHNRCG